MEVVTRQTAVPDLVSVAIFSHTNRYLPPAADCVCVTVTVGRLQATSFACRLRPEISSMTSGVKPIHQLGGSTLVMVGSFPTFSCAAFGAAALTQSERIRAQYKAKSERENERAVSKVRNFFTREE